MGAARHGTAALHRRAAGHRLHQGVSVAAGRCALIRHSIYRGAAAVDHVVGGGFSHLDLLNLGSHGAAPLGLAREALHPWRQLLLGLVRVVTNMDILTGDG